MQKIVKYYKRNVFKILNENVNKNSNKHEIADILTMFCSSFVIVKLYLVLFCSFSVANKLYSVQLVPFPQTQFLCMFVTYKKNNFKSITLPQYNGAMVFTSQKSQT